MGYVKKTHKKTLAAVTEYLQFELFSCFT